MTGVTVRQAGDADLAANMQFVLAAHRNRGIGRLLLDAVLAYAAERRFARVVLSPSERSVPFYRRAGFRSADELLVWTPAGQSS